MFGKPSPLAGRPAWNKGLTAKTDDRLFALGQKISRTAKEQFASGVRSNVGNCNPNYGNTTDTLDDEKRRNFSEAAIKRVLLGQSGYKTGHVTGVYTSQKCSVPVKFKSSWELAAMMWWDCQDEVLSYEYEPIVVTLVDQRRAIPDFLVKYRTCGELIEIKPTSIQILPTVRDKLVMVNEAVTSLGYVYRLLGDDTIHQMIEELGDKYTNAVNVYKSRK
jgi:hypothetical protein